MAVGDLTPKKYQVVLGATDTDVVAAIAANKRLHITGIRVINANSATKYFSLHLVPSGQTVADLRLLSPKQSKLDGTGDASGGGIYSDSMPFALDTGDKISGIAESATSITVLITGLEEALT
jgi:hypothetical protein